MTDLHQMTNNHTDSAISDIRMKLSLAHMVLMVALVMFVLGILAPHVVKTPEDMDKVSLSRRSVMTSGLQPKSRQMLNGAAFVVFTCVLVLYLYLRKLGRAFTCENDILRLRRCGTAYQLLLTAAGIMNMAQVVFTITGLLTIQHITYAHILHSRLFGNLGCLLICILFFLIAYDHIRAFRTLPPSIILAA